MLRPPEARYRAGDRRAVAFSLPWTPAPGGAALVDRERYLEPVADPFRALAETFVPEVSEMSPSAYARLVEIVERALDDRTAGIRRQLLLLVRALDWLPVFRYGRRLRSLDRGRRADVLEGLQESRLLALRRGVWGLRTLVFMGYYGREEAREEIGYRARSEGWEARR